MTLCVLDIFAAYHCCKVLTQTDLPCYNSVKQDGSSVLLYPTLEVPSQTEHYRATEAVFVVINPVLCCT